jgi:hypothetical protein
MAAIYPTTLKKFGRSLVHFVYLLCDQTFRQKIEAFLPQIWWTTATLNGSGFLLQPQSPFIQRWGRSYTKSTGLTSLRSVGR